MDGQCRTLNFAAFGSVESRKNDLLRYLQSIPSFERILKHNFPVPTKIPPRKQEDDSLGPTLLAARALSQEHQQRSKLLSDADGDRFTEYCTMDVPLPACPRANAHRLHIVSGPSNPERIELCRELLGDHRRAVKSLLPSQQVVDAVILFCSDAEDKACAAMKDIFDAVDNDDDWDEKRKLLRLKTIKESQPQVLKYLDMCLEHNVERVLFVKTSGGPLSDVTATKISRYNENSPPLYYDAPSKQVSSRNRVRVVLMPQEERAGYLELLGAFFRFVEDTHATLEADDALIAERKAAFEIAEQRRRATKLPLELPLASVAATRQWSADGTHDPQANHRIEFALVGEPQSGKTTFVTALVDRFVIRQHDPTTLLECAHASLNLGGDIGPVNLVFHDGPLPKKDIRLFPKYGTAGGPLPSLSLTVLMLFVDARDPNGLDSAVQALDQFPFPRPPYVAVLLTHTDEVAAKPSPLPADSGSGTVVIPTQCTSENDARLFAGSVNAYFSVVDCRNLQAVTELVERIVLHVQLQANKSRINLERQLLISQHSHHFADTKKLYVPHTEEDILIAFHRYDTQGDGFIPEADAKHELERLGLTLFVSFEQAVKEMEKKYGRLQTDEEGGRIVSKDQFALLMCRMSSL